MYRNAYSDTSGNELIKKTKMIKKIKKKKKNDKEVLQDIMKY